MGTIDIDSLNGFFNEMIAEAEKVVLSGANDTKLCCRRTAFMRYHGQGHEIEIELPDRILAERDLDEIKKKFEAEYSRQFSRIVPGMTVEILNWGVSVWSPISHEAKKIRNISDRRVEASAQREIICDVSGKRKKADVFDRASLQAGAQISGPALIVEPQTTTLVSCDFSAVVDGESNIWLTRGGVSPT